MHALVGALSICPVCLIVLVASEPEIRLSSSKSGAKFHQQVRVLMHAGAHLVQPQQRLPQLMRDAMQQLLLRQPHLLGRSSLPLFPRCLGSSLELALIAQNRIMNELTCSLKFWS